MLEMIFALVFGLLVGSFLNVVIYRLPVMIDNQIEQFVKEHLKEKQEKQEKELKNNQNNLENIEKSEKSEVVFNLMTPPSRCGNCGSQIRPWQNVPVFSWLFLKGKCANCQTSISIRYPLVELLTGVLFALVAWRYGWDYVTVWGCLLTAFVVAAVFIDADTQLLPDDLTIPLVWLGLLFNVHTGFISLQSAILGAVVGYLSLYCLNQGAKLILKREGMGYGDFKMLAAIGAWCGTGSLAIVAFFASVVGIIAAVAMGVKKSQPMAYGPCLGVAGWLVFLFHDKVDWAVSAWLKASGF